MTNDGHFVRVSVSGMARDPRDNPVVLLKSDEGDDVLPIWIGHAEAMAIELHLKGTHFERPLTHDLLRTLIENLGASVVKVAITDLREGTFFAKIHLQRADELFVIDARPSDSVALALKWDTAGGALDNGRQIIHTQHLRHFLRRHVEDGFIAEVHFALAAGQLHHVLAFVHGTEFSIHLEAVFFQQGLARMRDTRGDVLHLDNLRRAQVFLNFRIRLERRGFAICVDPHMIGSCCGLLRFLGSRGRLRILRFFHAAAGK